MPTEGYELTIYLMVGIAVFLGVEVLYLSIARRATYLRQVNARLKLLQTAADSHDVLLELARAALGPRLDTSVPYPDSDAGAPSPAK